MNNANRYLRVWFLSLIGTAVAGAAVNMLVDPYGLWDSQRVEGFNALKPQAATRSRAVKPRMLMRIQPNSVIIGNSRPEMGLDPNDNCWASEYKSVFSLTQPGAGVAEQLMLAVHSIEATNPSFLFVGVDFADYLYPKTRKPKAYDPAIPLTRSNRLLKRNFNEDNPERTRAVLEDYLAATFSLTALSDSIATIAKQNGRFPGDISRDGFNSAAEFLSSIRHEGQSVLFSQKIEELERQFAPDQFLAIFGKNESRGVSILKLFLDFASSKNVEVVLFINPLHADYLDTIHRNGYWKQFERWKEVLTRTVSDFSVPLWDFTDYDKYSTDTSVTSEPLESLTWYWEPAHYKSELGRLMISRFMDGCPGRAKSDFGKLLTPDNVKEHLKSVRSNRDDYQDRKEAPSGTDYSAKESIKLGR